MNHVSDDISVIDTETNTVITTVNAGMNPASSGKFIGYIQVPYLIIPAANFSANVTSGDAPLAVQFTDLSQYSTGRTWDFNNDWQGDSSEVSPTYVFTNPGTYNVNLIASNENGTDKKNCYNNCEGK